MFTKTREISEYDRPIEDAESPDDGGADPAAKDQYGTNEG
jgi:hypothetical protein